ncbi:hypothetical protein CBM2598_U10315 [Cupriavidus taiwanensis]|nr:hypothetical protein CBM2598_U10315 [Cupriavidus taiwanensis]
MGALFCMLLRASCDTKSVGCSTGIFDERLVKRDRILVQCWHHAHSFGFPIVVCGIPD